MLLRDKNLQAKLREDGFVVVPFLSGEELQKLNEFYQEAHGEQDPPLFIEEIHMTSWCQDPHYKKKISEGLKELVAKASERFFKNFRRLNHVFIVKKSGKNTVFKVHQDWNVVDETLFESVNVWVPLHDVDESSGALWVLKGSHRIQRPVRGAGYLFPDYSAHLEALEKEAISVKLKAGEAIVFYHSVIHGSPSNLSGHLRKAACFTVIPKEAPLCIYFQPTAQHSLEQYEPTDDFIFNYEHLRTQTLTQPPAPKPVTVRPPFVNDKVEAKELTPFLRSKWSLFSFFRS